MNDVQWDFIIEMLMCREEQSLITALRAEPKDELTRAAYADWLEERGRTKAAKYIRNGWTLTYWEYGKPPQDFTKVMVSGAIYGGGVASGFMSFIPVSRIFPPMGASEITSSGAITANELRQITSPYEDFHS